MQESVSMAPAGRAPVERIPVSLLTGFLGAGKTTLLNHWVRQPEMAGVAVLVNEFGEVGIDHHLVDTAGEPMVLLDSGCLCCTMQGDLVAALKNLFTRMAQREIPPVTRVVIETTGLADPLPVLFTLMEEPFVSARYVCDAVVTAISATHGLAQLGRHAETRRQVVMADRLLLTKCDQASTAVLHQLGQALHEHNPQAEQIQVRHGRADPDVLLTTGMYGRKASLAGMQAWLEGQREDDLMPGASAQAVQRELGALPALLATPDQGEAKRAEGAEAMQTGGGRYLGSARRRRGGQHSSQVTSFVVTFDQAVPWFGFAVVMGRILRQYGASLLRVKGLIRAGGDDSPVVVQCVQAVAYPVVRLPAWPQEGPFADGCGRLVWIVQGLGEAEEAAIRALLAELPGDAAALRASASDWNLPTRCWLSQRLPVMGPDALRHEAWRVQTKQLRA